jgi:hypothetical protein
VFQKLRPSSIYDVMAAIGCLAALVGGTAYAANTIGSSDIIDESIQSADIKNGEVKSVDIGDGQVNSADVKDQSLSTFDVHTFLGVDVVDGTLTGDDVQDNSLTGADINESTLNLPPGNVQTLDRVTLAAGQNAVLFTEGPLTFTARCGTASSAQNIILISTTEAGIAWQGSGSGFQFQLLGPSTPEANRKVMDGGPAGGGVFAAAFGAYAASTTSVTGDLYIGSNIPTTGMCIFGGQIVTP